MRTSPTQRTLKLLRNKGMTCQVVERWNQFAKVRQDLFGFIDIVAMATSGVATSGLEPGIIGVQCTSGEGGNRAARRAKIIAEPKAFTWLKAGGEIWLITWAKRGKGKVKTWQYTVEFFHLSEGQIMALEMSL